MQAPRGKELVAPAKIDVNLKTPGGRDCVLRVFPGTLGHTQTLSAAGAEDLMRQLQQEVLGQPTEPLRTRALSIFAKTRIHRVEPASF